MGLIYGDVVVDKAVVRKQELDGPNIELPPAMAVESALLPSTTSLACHASSGALAAAGAYLTLRHESPDWLVRLSQIPPYFALADCLRPDVHLVGTSPCLHNRLLMEGLATSVTVCFEQAADVGFVTVLLLMLMTYHLASITALALCSAVLVDAVALTCSYLQLALFVLRVAPIGFTLAIIFNGAGWTVAYAKFIGIFAPCL